MRLKPVKVRRCYAAKNTKCLPLRKHVVIRRILIAPHKVSNKFSLRGTKDYLPFTNTRIKPALSISWGGKRSLSLIFLTITVVQAKGTCEDTFITKMMWSF